MIPAAQIAAPKERPMLFSGPLVRRLPGIEPNPERWKTQTRRILAWQPKGPTKGSQAVRIVPAEGALWSVYGTGGFLGDIRCPYGRPGDRLWVRETWSVCEGEDGWSRWVQYRATPETLVRAPDDARLTGPGWRPSIFLPRWASRITLEVTEVRVERLQDISEKDARAEGVEGPGPGATVIDGKVQLGYSMFDVGTFATAREAFRFGWDVINKDRAPWASNPWVWVVGFRRLRRQQFPEVTR